jgi:hypothetical protein
MSVRPASTSAAVCSRVRSGPKNRGRAVTGIVALRAAGVILKELLIGIVDPAARNIDADLIILARDLREPFAVSTGSSSASIQIALCGSPMPAPTPICCGA